MKIIEGTIASPKGFKADGLHCGFKKRKKDIGILYSEVPAQAAGVFTTNQIQAAPVVVSREAIASGQTLQAVIINSGMANACTGEQGYKDAYQTQTWVAKKLDILASEIAVASTGVIGQLIPMETMEKGIAMLDVENGNAHAFHEAILTTDLCTKEVTVEEEIGGQKVTMSGVCKGSGMIHPNMATMLAFITTDAKIDGALLQYMLKETTEVTFNQITVDGDTSTNDSVIVMANGCAENQEILRETEDYQKFKAMFQLVAGTLARMIARDGEGATKLIEVHVKGARDTLDARMIAKKVVGSSLVKTAIFGEDPNWGRIICAVGYAGPWFNPEKVDIWIGDEQVLKDSQPVAFDDVKMHKILLEDTVNILVDLKVGEKEGTAWGCDLTYKYVEINACYHT